METDTYRTMITNFFVPYLNAMDVDDYSLYQNGVTCHTSHVIIDLLLQNFDGRLISDQKAATKKAHTIFYGY